MKRISYNHEHYLPFKQDMLITRKITVPVILTKPVKRLPIPMMLLERAGRNIRKLIRLLRIKKWDYLEK